MKRKRGRGLLPMHDRLGMANRINIVVTCANRKTVPVDSELELRTLKGIGAENRAERWIRRLSSPNRNRAVVADALYCGEHWSVVRSIPSVAKKAGRHTRIWICSAGYGLISSKSRLHPYNATFAAGDPNSVANGSQGKERYRAMKQWWRKLAKWKGPGPEKIRSLAKLARTYPKDALLLVASREYLLAVEDDLRDAARELKSPNLLMVVSAGTRQLGTLSPNLLPCDARLQNCLGGARVSLNARITRRLIGGCRAHRMEAVSATRYLSELLRLQPAIARQSRLRATDVQVIQFIRREMNKSGTEARSNMLRKFRKTGRACEQSRFAELYARAVDGK
jgi:hypothetical protein